ncbi:MAG: chemotaxis protein CheV [Gammaproteobacteria bacterium]|nr:chemotaxis protein CheV [Gammaproteobacteria bacterium]
MTGLLQNIDLRTQLAGHNRVELLLFRVNGAQRYGINVFKVREVIECPPLRRVPYLHPAIRGMATIRGRTMPIVDLGRVMGMRAVTDTAKQFVVLTEFNRSLQGFLVLSVDRIVNLSWKEVLSPSQGSEGGYLTAVTHVDGELIQILDVEHILADVSPRKPDVPADFVAAHAGVGHKPVLVVDDSSTARKMIGRTLDQLGIPSFMANNGREALALLRDWAVSGQPVTEKIGLVVSDIEMPEMDGYTLTTEIKKDPALQGLYVLLHSSLSGVFNDAMAHKVGADRFLAKFDTADFARLVVEISERTRIRPGAATGEAR